MSELSREESSRMRSIGRETASRIAKIAEDAARSAGMSRAFATVTKVNAGGTVEVDFGGSSHPMSVGAIRTTTDCAGASVGDVVVVDTFAYVPLVTGIVSTGSNGKTPISHGGTGATTASAAFKALSGYTLDTQTNNDRDTWVPVITGNAHIQHRVLPTLPFPVGAGGTGATDAATARSNLGLSNQQISQYACYSTYASDLNDVDYGVRKFTPSTSGNPTGDGYGYCITISAGNGGTYSYWRQQVALVNYIGIYVRECINPGAGASWTDWKRVTLYGHAVNAVYRLYNQYSKDHLFVDTSSEYNDLVKAGWTGEGVYFYAFKR